MSIYVVNLTEMNDRTLKTVMNSVPENSVILFEDIDCMKASSRNLESAELLQPQTARTDVAIQARTSDRGGVSLSGPVECAGRIPRA
jgi:chaperone BCS1